MCGIAGTIGSAPADRHQRLDRARQALAHRGPDGSGWFENELVGFVHTRLAVLDVSHAADQPMRDEATGCVLLFNGEIYNFREIRAELEGRGHRFHSSGDTEVLLRSYVQWGTDCVDKLNGMFAFAVWEPRHSSVVLARDRVGEKPLHYCVSDHAVWFASELKALIAAGACSTSVDRATLWGFLASGDLGHPERSALAGVRQLPPGHVVQIRADEPTDLNPVAFWEPQRDDSEGGVTSPDAIAKEFADLFSDSVRLRLRSDVPLGTSLSGGLDSSLVLATVRSIQRDGDLHAFTASFPGTPADELPHARAVADRLNVTLHPVPLRAEDLHAGLSAMVRANEGPVESPSTFAQYKVMEEARHVGITVLLDGQGADETWGGYDKYAGLAVIDQGLTGHPLAATRLARHWRQVRGQSLRPPVDRYLALLIGRRGRMAMAPLHTRAVSGWLSPSFRQAHRGTDTLDGVDADARIGHLADQHALLDLTRITLPRLLRYADRNSMAWSREVRLPFLDHRLVELSLSASFASKVVNGWTKEPVRRALSDLGLDEVARRRDKKAYMPPTAKWLDHPALAERVAQAWAQLYDAGYLASPTPSPAVLPKWRVLVTDVWIETMGLTLQGSLA